jgi:hypothetical protein
MISLNTRRGLERLEPIMPLASQMSLSGQAARLRLQQQQLKQQALHQQKNARRR